MILNIYIIIFSCHIALAQLRAHFIFFIIYNYLHNNRCNIIINIATQITVNNLPSKYLFPVLIFPDEKYFNCFTARHDEKYFNCFAARHLSKKQIMAKTRLSVFTRSSPDFLDLCILPQSRKYLQLPNFGLEGKVTGKKYLAL